MNETYLELYEKLSRLEWLLHRNRLQTHADHGPVADPTRGQGRVLAMLRLQPEISAKDLSYLLGIRQQSLNELLGKLEKSGYITRTPSENDKRVILIRLTEQGRDAQPDNMEFTGIFTCLTQEEQEIFGEYLDRVIAALEARLGDEVDEEAASAWEKDARERFGDAWMERFREGPHGAPPFRRGPMHRGERGGPMERGPRPIPHEEWRGPMERGPRPMPHEERGGSMERGPRPMPHEERGGSMERGPWPMPHEERGGPMERGPRPIPHEEWRNLTEGGPAEDNKTLSECRDENQPPKSNPHNIDGN